MENDIKTLFAPFFRKPFNKDFLADRKTLIVIDTNYLLSILRLSPDLAIKYINALINNKENIYIPYIVALEFNFNKSSVKYENKKNIETINEIKDNIKKVLSESQIKLSKILLTDQLDRIKRHNDTYLKKLDSELHSIKETDRNKTDNDTYNSLIDAISTKIGEKPTQLSINNIEAEGKTRYENKIAPGYNDEKNKVGSRSFDGIEYQRKYGDLLIWKDIILKAKELKKKRVIFVTDDGTSGKKDDLFYKIDGNKIGPAIEMMDELYKDSNADLYILRNEHFVSETVELNEQQKQEIRNLSIANKEIVYKTNLNDNEKLIKELNQEIQDLQIENLFLLDNDDELQAKNRKENEDRIEKLKIALTRQNSYNKLLKMVYGQKEKEKDQKHNENYIDISDEDLPF
ncbi:hypothetical protein J3325_10455 [Leuconostoc mesenteroides]|uniref:PIN-like domain-containing protein n=3 Tax=Leuconostoc mesenteroides TaxID=1245 RepID=UPI001CBFA4B7|nr:PIN-like domain-containing protein [Leuconostoc mesenteroides]MBZ1521578.1 hypothetical protein [Leuconostoc mesenteroides]MBZ1528166.1 hypothetical protein [Leuconostoc mesenteroides]